MEQKAKILIVDDKKENRECLQAILQEEYEITEAENGKEAVILIAEQPKEFSAIILDLEMAEMDGLEFLKLYGQSKTMKKIPLIVASEEDLEKELQCLERGAWDYVRKPFHKKILRFRLKNVIERSELKVLKELQYLQQFDPLTGLYKRETFIEKMENRMQENPDEKFILLHFDICKFQTYNAIFGTEEGDRMLQYLAQLFRLYETKIPGLLYGREEADVFLALLPYREEEELKRLFVDVQQRIDGMKENYHAMTNFGVYVIEDRSVPVRLMLDRVKLAASLSKGNYIKNYAYYTEELQEEILLEQQIVNNMKQAMEKEEFILYIQPKYELMNHTVEGGEILVRWKKEDGTLVSPGDFIPIFEKNGFIMELDYYVWEHACRLLRKWLDEGRNPHPISVNISRISLYNPKLVDQICGLVEKYQIPPVLFQLELTESAYTSNPMSIKKDMRRLQEKGFSVLMDDFGSGYSSLNVLKDIAVDILKIDMRFMGKSDMPGRSENILASVVRMAKWLNMPVIAEGVETAEQVAFLQSIGCEFVQGYYFARPMPIEEYEVLVSSSLPFQEKEKEEEDTDSLWNVSSQMDIIFENMLQAVCVYEYENGYAEVIRVNRAYYDMLGYQDLSEFRGDVMRMIAKEDRHRVSRLFECVAKNQTVEECEHRRILPGGREIWVNLKVKYISKVGKKHILFGALTDITEQCKANLELHRYRKSLAASTAEKQTILIVDDVESNRANLKSIFEADYRILQAEDGTQALECLEKEKYRVDLILLDLRMPKMDGKTFLEYRSKDARIKKIPVVVITADDSKQMQIACMRLGASDYIVKPFIPEIVVRRICNVLRPHRDR
ncbi:MAG: EAL domain-containing protein [Lachnospiraceae bacterium]